MTLKKNGITIATNGDYVKDTSAGVTYETVNSNGSEVWRRSPETPGHISYSSSKTVGSSVSISWWYASRASTYTIEQKIGSGSFYSIKTTSSSSTSIIVNSVSTYYFRVKANNSGGSSGYKTGGSLSVVPKYTVSSIKAGMYEYTIFGMTSTYTGYAHQYKFVGDLYSNLGSITGVYYNGYKIRLAVYGTFTGYADQFWLALEGKLSAGFFNRIVTESGGTLYESSAFERAVYDSSMNITRWKWNTGKPSSWINNATKTITIYDNA